MKKCTLVAAFLMICAPGVFAQESKKLIYNSINNIEKNLPVEVKYQYPKFMPGVVYFKDGSTGTGNLNYNLLVREIQFIETNGDTLALDGITKVDYITIGDDTFFYNKGVLLLLGIYDPVKLAVKEYIRVVERQKIGAFGMASSAGSIDSYQRMSAGRGIYDLGINENVVLSKDANYFLVRGSGDFVPATINNIIKSFPAKKQEIEKFVSEQRIDLKKEEDIKRLLSFCSGS